MRDAIRANRLCAHAPALPPMCLARLTHSLAMSPGRALRHALLRSLVAHSHWYVGLHVRGRQKGVACLSCQQATPVLLFLDRYKLVLSRNPSMLLLHSKCSRAVVGRRRCHRDRSLLGGGRRSGGAPNRTCARRYQEGGMLASALPAPLPPGMMGQGNADFGMCHAGRRARTPRRWWTRCPTCGGTRATRRATIRTAAAWAGAAGVRSPAQTRPPHKSIQDSACL